ncbi:MAG: DUF937 domain-containing protein [Solobacterium sp.]|nr:DUF937 domain-containing protein [Solobacterium sp.]
MSNSLLGLLTSSLTQQSSLNAASKKSGLSTRQILTIMSYALPLIMKAMTKNASSQSGATSLLGALTQHTSKRSVAEQIETADTADGEKIVKHIFGGDTSNMLSQIAGATGSGTQEVSSVLSSFAPALLSSLSAATTTANTAQQNKKQGIDLSDGLDVGELMTLFGGGQQQAQQQAPASGLNSLLGAFLGGGAQPQQQAAAADDGSALLSSLLSFMK